MIKTKIQEMRKSCGLAASAISISNPFDGHGFKPLHYENMRNEEPISNDEVAVRLCDIVKAITIASLAIVDFLTDEELYWTMDGVKESLDQAKVDLIAKRKRQEANEVLPRLVRPLHVQHSSIALGKTIDLTVEHLNWIKADFDFGDIQSRMVDIPNILQNLIIAMEELREHVIIPGK